MIVDIYKNKTYMIITKWSYPFGGGEEFMYQTMEWGTRLGMKCFWLSFWDGKNNKPYESVSIEKKDCGIFIKINGGFDEKNIKNWIKLIGPEVVHHQGSLREDIYKCCSMQRVEFMSGFHFWTGAIILDPIVKNINILENYDKHLADEELLRLESKKDCHLYTVTKFVSDCIEKVTKVKIPYHIYASSSYKRNFIDMDIKKNIFVTVINTHYLKGGKLFLWLLKNCPQISFLGVKTEPHSEDLDEQIEDAINERIVNGYAISMVIDRVSDARDIYSNTKILLATSKVDETFCRVVNEAMMNGIPVISTGQGNIKYLMGESGHIIPLVVKGKKEEEFYPMWKKKIQEIYFDEAVLVKESKKAVREYQKFSEEKAFSLFSSFTNTVLKHSKEMNVMIFSPWCDQGLGIQSRNYARILESTDYNVFVFAVKPYNADTCIQLQKNPEEWAIEFIRYSPHNREQVTDGEIIQFIKDFKIGKCLLPETCWYRVFEVAELLKEYGVKCYAIPNIEIVRKDELFKHNYFHKILANNQLCIDIFNKYGVNKTEYIGYGIDDVKFGRKNITSHYKLLFIGGMNAFSRKHILSICEGFVQAYEKNNNIQLTCTIQRTNLLEKDDQEKIKKYFNHPGINIIQSHLKYSEILNLYYTHHISIQVSKHEGLGIGFYEALSTGTPIITLDTPPHNEIVRDGINGWIIPCSYKKMIDNKDPIFYSAYFNPIDLAKKINEIIEKNDLSSIIKTLLVDYTNRLSITKFREKFINAINN